MKSIEELKTLEKQLEEFGLELAKNKWEYISRTAALGKEISSFYGDFISLSGTLKQYGIDVPVETLTAQLEHFVEACSEKDIVMLTDSINFEILDTLSVYGEILEQLS